MRNEKQKSRLATTVFISNKNLEVLLARRDKILVETVILKTVRKYLFFTTEKTEVTERILCVPPCSLW